MRRAIYPGIPEPHSHIGDLHAHLNDMWADEPPPPPTVYDWDVYAQGWPHDEWTARWERA